jgi:23S rRNA pseudouridine2604 synthase
MCQVLGYQVVTLKRVRIMHISINNLPIGKWRYFTNEEIITMEKLVASSAKTVVAGDYTDTGFQE